MKSHLNMAIVLLLTYTLLTVLRFKVLIIIVFNNFTIIFRLNMILTKHNKLFKQYILLL